MARRDLPPPSVRDEWLRRVEAEYRSAAITQHLTLWLMQIGASPDLLRAGLRIAGDEVRHAELSHRAYMAAGGEAPPALVRETLGLRRRDDEPLEHDVLRTVVEIFCLGETVAVPLFKELRAGATVPVARRALDRILVDEVRHRDFGWVSLEWLLSLPCAPALRVIVDRELPRWLARIRDHYGSSESTAVTPAERSWGLMAPATYRACVDKAYRRDYVPRFRRLGVDAVRAWGGDACA